jgi:hypothetical protein
MAKREIASQKFKSFQVRSKENQAEPFLAGREIK